MDSKPIQSALISVYHKNGLDEIIKQLAATGVKFFSTGGTQKFIEGLGFEVTAVEEVTNFPEMLGGRVKTLQPQIMGGILFRREHETDLLEVEKHKIPAIDLVIVDLYPFEETVKSGANEEDIIEKIDIGGISLIRAGAKNFNDVAIVPSQANYQLLLEWLKAQNNSLTLQQRRLLAKNAFNVSSHYDSLIFKWFAGDDELAEPFKQSIQTRSVLRYGENPHQKGVFYGDLDALFEKLNGKELSYNNLLDVDAAVALIDEFEDCTFAILKHNNACGVATDPILKEAYLKAFRADSTSAFGGVLITNREVDFATAIEMHKLFFEVLIAPSFEGSALELLKEKKNRVLLKRNPMSFSKTQFRTLLNGVIAQDKDLFQEKLSDFKTVTKISPSEEEKRALLFAVKVVKHTKSNTIVLAKDNMLISSGVGQTSRVDALKQAIEKAKSFGFDLNGAVMASDAFFPFPDCVEIASKEGIKLVVQPGGSIKDADSIAFCDANGMSMVMTGVRHFKH
ncbi:MAG: bifunctional phosphoribosylaminoimidazolecarboxamide formyltransferase/IMP cyclohydrolase [Cytophagales bacterium]